MIAHKCTPLCDPDEGVHCIAEMWRKGKTLDDFQEYTEELEIIKIREESDITKSLFKALYPGLLMREIDEQDVGYLIWVKDR